jgi:hypothetical protein
VRPDPFIVKNCGAEALKQFDILLTALASGERNSTRRGKLRRK